MCRGYERCRWRVVEELFEWGLMRGRPGRLREGGIGLVGGEEPGSKTEA